MKTLKRSLALICLSSFTFMIAQKKAMGSLEKDLEIVVAKGTSPDLYSSSIELNDDRNQLIMAGQNYQTNYGIYARIKAAPSNKGKNYRLLENISFEIVNYKPTYFMGIDSIVVARATNGKQFMLKIFTKAMSENNTYDLTKEDLKGLHMENGSYLHSERTLNPMFPKKDNSGNVLFDTDGRVSCDSNNGKVFDFEFFYVDGKHEVRKADYDKEKENKQTYLNEVFSTLPAGRCRNSFNKVIF